jgi:uncharacterized protein (DUF2336 family)
MGPKRTKASLQNALQAREEMLVLARSRAPEDRERLLIAVADLCEQADGPPEPSAQAFVTEIFLHLAAQADEPFRRRLAERIAAASWAPAPVVRAFALAEIEAARPVIQFSPILGEDDLLGLLARGSVAHRMAVAARPGLGARAVQRLLDQADPVVLGALAENHTADISETGVEILVGYARESEAVGRALALHPRLTLPQAVLMQAWVDQTVRNALADRFPELRPASEPEPVPPPVPPAAEDPRGPERKLAAKLNAAGQLRPGYLLKALREGKLAMFEAGMAALGDFEPDEVAKAAFADSPELLALACNAVEIDRSVFPTLLELVRQQTGGAPGEATRETIARSYAWSPAEAADVFRARVSAV